MLLLLMLMLCAVFVNIDSGDAYALAFLLPHFPPSENGCAHCHILSDLFFLSFCAISCSILLLFAACFIQLLCPTNFHITKHMAYFIAFTNNIHSSVLWHTGTERERAKRAHHNYLFISRIYAEKDTKAAIKSNSWDRGKFIENSSEDRDRHIHLIAAQTAKHWKLYSSCEATMIGLLLTMYCTLDATKWQIQRRRRRQGQK